MKLLQELIKESSKEVHDHLDTTIDTLEKLDDVQNETIKELIKTIEEFKKENPVQAG